MLKWLLHEFDEIPDKLASFFIIWNKELCLCVWLKLGHRWAVSENATIKHIKSNLADLCIVAGNAYLNGPNNNQIEPKIYHKQKRVRIQNNSKMFNWLLCKLDLE